MDSKHLFERLANHRTGESLQEKDWRALGHQMGISAFKRGATKPVDDNDIDWKSIPDSARSAFLSAYTNGLKKAKIARGDHKNWSDADKKKYDDEASKAADEFKRDSKGRFSESESLKIPPVADLRRLAKHLGKVVTLKTGRRRYVVTCAHVYGITSTDKKGTVGYTIAALSGGDKGSHEANTHDGNFDQYWSVDSNQEIVFSGKNASKRKRVFDADLSRGEAPRIHDAGSQGKHVVAMLVMDRRSTKVEEATDRDWAKMNDKMANKGYRYKLTFKSGKHEPLFSKTQANIGELMREYPNEKFDVQRIVDAGVEEATDSRADEIRALQDELNAIGGDLSAKDRAAKEKRIRQLRKSMREASEERPQARAARIAALTKAITNKKQSGEDWSDEKKQILQLRKDMAEKCSHQPRTEKGQFDAADGTGQVMADSEDEPGFGFMKDKDANARVKDAKGIGVNEEKSTMTAAVLRVEVKVRTITNLPVTLPSGTKIRNVRMDHGNVHADPEATYFDAFVGGLDGKWLSVFVPRNKIPQDWIHSNSIKGLRTTRLESKVCEASAVSPKDVKIGDTLVLKHKSGYKMAGISDPSYQEPDKRVKVVKIADYTKSKGILRFTVSLNGSQFTLKSDPDSWSSGFEAVLRESKNDTLDTAKGVQDDEELGTPDESPKQEITPKYDNLSISDELRKAKENSGVEESTVETKIDIVKTLLKEFGFDAASKDVTKENVLKYAKWVLNQFKSNPKFHSRTKEILNKAGLIESVEEKQRRYLYESMYCGSQR